jgi:hypothetical protein
LSQSLTSGLISAVASGVPGQDLRGFPSSHISGVLVGDLTDQITQEIVEGSVHTANRPTAASDSVGTTSTVLPALRQTGTTPDRLIYARLRAGPTQTNVRTCVLCL